MLALPTCRWRGEVRAEDCDCHSLRFVAAPNKVRHTFCRECYYPDHEPVVSIPRVLPCVHQAAMHQGDTTDTYPCTLHGLCRPNPHLEGTVVRPEVRPCISCTDYLPRDPFGADSGTMLRKAEAYLAALPTYPTQQYSGRGVVIAGGGERYFASLYVTVRALRHVGCALPIQVWYLGNNGEMPEDRQAILVPYGVECVDADEVRKRYPAKRLNGWELKAFATLHSPYEEVLFLDADCYPCRNPTYLFDLLEYRVAGAIFWPDMAVCDDRLKWPAFGVPAPGRLGSVESGQYVIDKRKCWKALNLAWFYNDHSDYYYRYAYGDKHTFEVAWERCGPSFVMWQVEARWSDVAYLHPGPEGDVLFIHRCADKFRFEMQHYITHQHNHSSRYYPNLPLERECWRWLAELAERLGYTLNLPVEAEAS